MSKEFLGSCSLVGRKAASRDRSWRTSLLWQWLTVNIRCVLSDTAVRFFGGFGKRYAYKFGGVQLGIQFARRQEGRRFARRFRRKVEVF